MSSLESLKSAETLLSVNRDSLPVLRVSGNDAERYLHGRITQNIKSLRAETGNILSGSWSLVLSPQGRIQGQFIIARIEAGFLIVSDPVEDEAELRSAILQFRVSDDVTIESLSSEYAISQLFGSERESFANSLELPKASWALSSNILGLSSTFLVVPRTQAHFHPPIASAGEEFYQLLRIKSGVPQFGKDLSEKVLAPETDLSDLVSFNKGCYAGQEVVEMATARGRPNRRLISFSVPGNHLELCVGVEVQTSEGVAAGTVTSLVFSPEEEKQYGLALVKTSALESGAAFLSHGHSLQLS